MAGRVTSRPKMYRVVIPGKDLESTGMPLIELSFHRVVIAGADQESTAIPLIELSLLAQTRNPPLCLSSSCHFIELSFHRVVIPGADQESTGLAIQGDSWIPGLRQE